MFDKSDYDKEYMKTHYKKLSVLYRPDNKTDSMTIENLRLYAKDHNISVQKTIMFALEKFLSDNGYI